MKQLRRRACAAALTCAVLGLIAPAAQAKHGPSVPELNWAPCGDAPNVTCADVEVPRDYDRPGGRTITLHVAKSPATDPDPAQHLGPLFINFGGPGGTAADTFEAAGADAFPALNERYDIIAMDPRGVGQSSPSIDCKANQETQGIYSQPFTTPDNLDVGALIRKDRTYIGQCIANSGDILAHVSTANVARDIDLLRRAMGEDQITYFGYSYGTFLGATFASMFPRNYRRMVLDGPVDADSYINEPMDNLAEQSTGFERAIGHFFEACARDQAACRGFGGADPRDAFDALVDQANATPIPAGGPDPRPVDGDDVLAGTAIAIYNKGSWPFLAAALANAALRNDGTLLRIASDAFYGRLDDGTYDPITDRYFTITAVEQRYEKGNVGLYLKAGKRSWSEHEHTFWNNGYTELNYGLYPIRDRDAFDGPFRIPGSSATPLVVATTYDPATPYRGALNLVRDLGNARLITMRGDGHTSYSGNSACIDAAVEAYLNDGTLPAKGTQCRQDVGFPAPQQQSASRQLGVPALGALKPRLHVKGQPLTG
jgi:pimeloyl-ACP methyl ester carboxylesterase